MVITMKRGTTVIKVAESQVAAFKTQGYEVYTPPPARAVPPPAPKTWQPKDEKARADRLGRAGTTVLVREGHTITAEHAQAPALRAAGWVEPHEVPAEKPESRGRALLLKLDPKDESLWAEDGRPKIAGLQAALGLPKLTLKDVMAVWPEFTREALVAELTKGA